MIEHCFSTWALSAQMNLQKGCTLFREQVGAQLSKLNQNTQNWLQQSEKKIELIMTHKSMRINLYCS